MERIDVNGKIESECILKHNNTAAVLVDMTVGCPIIAH